MVLPLDMVLPDGPLREAATSALRAWLESDARTMSTTSDPGPSGRHVFHGCGLLFARVLMCQSQTKGQVRLIW